MGLDPTIRTPAYSTTWPLPPRAASSGEIFNCAGPRRTRLAPPPPPPTATVADRKRKRSQAKLPSACLAAGGKCEDSNRRFPSVYAMSDHSSSDGQRQCRRRGVNDEATNDDGKGEAPRCPRPP